MDYNRVVKIVETKQTADGKNLSRLVQKFNANEQIVQELEYRYDFKDGAEFLREKTEFRYDTTGKIQSKYKFTGHYPSDTGFWARDLEKTVTYEYDTDGRVVKAIEEGDNEDTEGRSEYSTIFEYFEDGTKIGKRYSEQSSLIAIEHYNQYDHLIQEDSYLGAYLFLTKFRKYDLSGNLLEESWRYEDTGHPNSKNYEVGVVFQFGRHEYDASGNEIATFNFKGQTGDISREVHSIFNEQNQMIQSSVIYHDKPELNHTTTYEYEVTVHNIDPVGIEDGPSVSTAQLPQSAQILLRKAEGGDIGAIMNVAANYCEGDNDFPADIELAFRWCKKGLKIDVHNVELWVQLAHCHEKADTDVDKGAAHKAYRCAAELGHVPSMYIVAEDLYYENDESKKAECLPWLERAVSNQDGRAEALLGYIYLKGELQTNSHQRGIELLDRSAEHGDPQGARILAEAYLHQIDGCEQVVPYSLSKAAQYFAIAVDNGEDTIKALYYAGLAFFYGEGVPKNTKKARKCIESLIDVEYVPEEKVFDLLGCMCFEGEGGPVDYTLGEKALRRAIGSDDAEISLEAMNNLGMYLYALTNRLSESIQLLQKAADQGNANAQVNLGKAYCEGKGVSQDVGIATHYFRLAAAQGNQIALDNLKVIQSSNNSFSYSHTNTKKRHPIRGAIIGGVIGIIISLVIGPDTFLANVVELLGIVVGLILGWKGSAD